MSEKVKWFMRLTMQNADTGKSGFAMYPCDKYAMLESLDVCGVPYGAGNYTHLAVSANGVEADSLQTALTGVIEHQTHPPSIYELNFLGSQIQVMKPNERSRMEQELVGSPDATIVEAITLAHKALGERIKYDSISMSGRAVLFRADEPYIKVRLATEAEMDTSEDAGTWVDCPATDAELEAVADKLGMESYHDLEVCDVYGIVESFLYDLIQSPFFTFEQLNDWAKAMKDNEVCRQSAKYKAVLRHESCYDLENATELAGNLDSYEFYIGESLADVGNRFRSQNPYELDEDELAEDMGFDESEYGTLRKVEGMEQEHTGQTLH